MRRNQRPVRGHSDYATLPPQLPLEKLAAVQEVPAHAHAAALQAPFQLAQFILDYDEDNPGLPDAKIELPPEVWAELVDLAGQVLEAEGIERMPYTPAEAQSLADVAQDYVELVRDGLVSNER